MTTRLMQGHVIAVLRSLPSESIQTVVTSPPYWGLRSYGSPEQVWGGDDLCSHVWGEQEPPKRQRWGNIETLSEKQSSNRGSAANVQAMELPAGAFCQTCGAWKGHLGLEPTPQLFVAHLVDVFREVRRVLRRDGTLWLNLGDSYATGAGKVGDCPGGGAQGDSWTGPTTQPNRMPIPGLKPKDLCGIPWRVALALQEDGWWLRSDIIWAKPNPLPESITDRPTKSHEYLFLLTKAAKYFYDAEAVKEKAVSARGETPNDWDTGPGRHGTIHRATLERERRGHASGATVPIHKNGQQRHGYAIPDTSTRNRRSVWTIATQPFARAHFATFPERLVEPCVLAGTSDAGVCPACGAGWVRIVATGEANREHQLACGCDVNGEYHGTATKDFAGNGAQNASAVKARILAGMREKRTIGWKPTCSCERDLKMPVRPAVVMDPFAGSGTVGVVAKRLGRSFIGIDLSADYLAMARERIDGTCQRQPTLFDAAVIGGAA